MDGDECGNGFTGSTSPGTTSAWSNSHTCLNLTETLVPKVIWRAVQEHESIADHIMPACSLLLLYTCWTLIVRSRLRAKRESRPARTAEWSSLPPHVQERVIGGLPFEKVYQLKAVSNSLRKCIESDSFQSSENVTLIAPHFFISEGAWHCAGYDSSLRKWRRLPPFPASCMPDPDLFKQYLVCSHGGIICMNVSKGAEEERLVVLNPLTGKWRELPPLKHRRNPVLMHLVVDAATQSYRVVVAGSARSGDGRLSRVTEEFDSLKWEWKQTSDVPGPDYALNEFQSGVWKDGSLYCTAFLDDEAGKGIIRYNLKEGTWVKNWTYPIPFAAKSSILQLVESWGGLYMFSEQDNGSNNIEHCIDRVEFDDINGRVSLTNVVKSKKLGGKSLEVYPEVTCMPYGEHQLCLFNTVDHSGVVYDVQSHGEYRAALDGPPSKGFSGESFYTLNAMTFTLQPSFQCKI